MPRRSRGGLTEFYIYTKFILDKHIPFKGATIVYTLANVRKFVEDNEERLRLCSTKILRRATEAATDGVIASGQIAEIMGDEALADEFREVAKNPAHVKLLVETASSVTAASSTT